MVMASKPMVAGSGPFRPKIGASSTTLSENPDGVVSGAPSKAAETRHLKVYATFLQKDCWDRNVYAHDIVGERRSAKETGRVSNLQTKPMLSGLLAWDTGNPSNRPERRLESRCSLLPTLPA